MLNIMDIQNILPHRYPFLLVDRVTEIEVNKRAVGLKNVTFNEPFFQGHFPGNPIMPGVLVIEAMAQVSGILAMHKGPQGSSVYFMSIDKAKFRRPVVPGDQLRFEANVLQRRKNVWKFAAQTFVEEQVVAGEVCRGRVGQRAVAVVHYRAAGRLGERIDCQRIACSVNGIERIGAGVWTVLVAVESGRVAVAELVHARDLNVARLQLQRRPLRRFEPVGEPETLEWGKGHGYVARPGTELARGHSAWF